MIYNFIIYTFSLYYDSSMDLKIIVQVPFYKYNEQSAELISQSQKMILQSF